MSITATLNLTLSVSGQGINDQSVPLASWQSTSSPGYRNPNYALSSGFNTLTPPQSAPLGGYYVIVVPAGVTATLKGVTGDTGYNAGSTGGVFFGPLNQSVPGSFGITVSSNCMVGLYFV